MSHHASGPNFGFPRGDARLDMTDLYAFTKPGDPNKSITDPECASIFQVGLAGADNDRALQARSAIRNQDRHKRRCRCRSRVTVCSSRLPETGSRLRQCAVLGQASRRAGRRRRSYRPASASVSRKGSPGDTSRRLPFFLRLAQRSLLFRRERQFQSHAVYRRRFLQRQKCLQHRAGTSQLRTRD